MPPLIRRSQSAVPQARRQGRWPLRPWVPPDGSTWLPQSWCAAGHRNDRQQDPQRRTLGCAPAATPAGARLPRRAVASTVFMLAPRCTGRSRSWPFPIGCSRVRPMVVKTLASELGPADPGQRAAARQDPPIGSVNLMPSVAIPLRYVPACLSTSRCAGTASPRSSAGRPHSCSPPPRPASPARCAMIPVDGVPSARSEHPVAGKAARTKVPGI